MNPIKNINAVIIAPFLSLILLSLPVQAQEDLSNVGMHPVLAPNIMPNQGQPRRQEVRVNTPPVRVETRYRVQPIPQPVVRKTPPVVNQNKPARHDQQNNHYKDVRRHDVKPDYFRRDANYYGYAQVDLPYAEVDPGFVVPDGFEVVSVNGETFYYNQGIFYQQVGNQLTAIPAVLGAVVDSIPEDYQIVMADGIHYLVTGGVYYQRVDQGFEVVEAPAAEGS